MPDQKSPQVPQAPQLEDDCESQTIQSTDTSVSVLRPGTQGGLQQYPMTDAVQQLTEAKVLKHQGVNTLLAVLARLRETDLNDARAERKAVETEANEYREKYHIERTKRHVLEERLRGENSFKKMQNILISLGGIVLGSVIQPLTASFSWNYLIFSVVGIALMLVGWLYEGKSEKEQR